MVHGISRQIVSKVAAQMQVTLLIQPHSPTNNGTAPQTIPLKRQRIAFEAVSQQLCQPLGADSPLLGTTGRGDASSRRLGYIRVATFSQATSDGVRGAITKLKREGADR